MDYSTLDLVRNALVVTMLISAPVLLAGVFIGLVISIMQSVTQIQEITLTFVPKIVVVMLSFVFFLPWMVGIMTTFVRPLLGNAHLLIR